jgi:NAD(P)-dependent dehydrogenase (short-subunit alcohol dehydrogenase family)
MILARLAAKKAVQEKLRADGVRVSLVLPRDIATKTNEYLALHPELYEEARERAVRMGMFEKPKRRRTYETLNI